MSLPGDDEVMARSLFPDPTTCVVCFHAGHPEAMCMEDEPSPDPEGSICGCIEYVTEEQRGQRVVILDGRQP